MTGFLGVLMLDTGFPRIVGDVGNAASYPVPVRLKTVPGADVTEVVRAAGPSPEIVAAFVDAAMALERAGATGLITSCGFMVEAQVRMAAAVAIPVVTSALCLGPILAAMYGGRIGVLTANSTALTPAMLRAAGMAPDQVAVAGMEGDAHWRDLILQSKFDQSREIDPPRIAAEAVRQATRLQDAHPDLTAILLECGNLPPYADEIRRATGLPVWSILDAARLIGPTP